MARINGILHTSSHIYNTDIGNIDKSKFDTKAE